MRQSIDDRCDDIDASVFSGDLLWIDEDRDTLKQYAERWLRAIAEHEKHFPSAAPVDGVGEVKP